MPRSPTLLLVLLLATTLAAAPAVAAESSETVHRTYEVPPLWNDTAASFAHTVADPTGEKVAPDGQVDAGGVTIERAQAPQPGGAAPDTVHIRIVDDRWGAGTVVGSACVDLNGDEVCGQPGESIVRFCGESPEIALPDGWTSVIVHLGGPGHQVLLPSCPVPPAPTGATTGGVFTEDGGLHLTFTVSA